MQLDKAKFEDPREALLKLDAAARADPMYLGKAYEKTQPQAGTLRALAATTLEEDLDETRVQSKRQKL